MHCFEQAALILLLLPGFERVPSQPQDRCLVGSFPRRCFGLALPARYLPQTWSRCSSNGGTPCKGNRIGCNRGKIRQLCTTSPGLSLDQLPRRTLKWLPQSYQCCSLLRAQQTFLVWSSQRQRGQFSRYPYRRWSSRRARMDHP